MTMNFLRAGVGVLLGVSGTLLGTASWQRWADVCAWGEGGSRQCLERQDHRYDVVVPGAPWEPVGAAAELAGLSLLVLALVFVLLPWTLAGRRPGVGSVALQVGVVLSLAAVGVGVLRSGLTGEVVDPVSGDVALWGWLLLTPVFVVHLAVVARGWGRAAAVLLVLASPLVAWFSYAVGPYDARPWWEAVSGLLVVGAGVCLLVAAVLERAGGPSYASRGHDAGRLGGHGAALRAGRR